MRHADWRDYCGAKAPTEETYFLCLLRSMEVLPILPCFSPAHRGSELEKSTGNWPDFVRLTFQLKKKKSTLHPNRVSLDVL